MTHLYGRSVTKRCYGHTPDWQIEPHYDAFRFAKQRRNTVHIVYEGGTTKEIFENYMEKTTLSVSEFW